MIVWKVFSGLFLFLGKRTVTIEDDPSLMTFRGHHVSQTLVRCRFSPAHSTGQKYIYSGCASGAVFSKYFLGLKHREENA